MTAFKGSSVSGAWSVFSGALFIGLLLLCPAARADVWADFHGTSLTTGIDSGARYNALSTVIPPFALSWSQTNWGGAGVNVIQKASPVVANGIVYLGSWDNNLYAWDSATGAAVPGFPVSTGSGIASAPAVANGIVYLGSTDQKLYAWNASTGAAIPGFPVLAGGWIQSSPAVVNGIVYFGSTDGKLNARNAANGAGIVGFPVSTGGLDLSSPAVANGAVYIGSTNNNLYAWNASTGAGIPGFPVGMGGPASAAPAVANGVVYIGSTDGKLYAWNAASGAAVPGFPVSAGGWLQSSPAIANGIVYIGCSDNKLYAWNAATGAAIAGFPVGTGSDIYSSPAVANGVVYVGSRDNNLYAFNAANGSLLWQYAMPSNFGSNGFDNCSVAIAEGKLFAASDQAAGILVFDPVTPSNTPSPSASPTFTATPSATPTPSITPTFSASPTALPSVTVSPTPSITPTLRPTPIPLRLRPHGNNPNPFTDGGTHIVYWLATKAVVEVRLYTLAGEPLRTLEPFQALAGFNEEFWDGRNAAGIKVASGVFVYRVRATDEQGKTDSYIEKCAVFR